MPRKGPARIPISTRLSAAGLAEVKRIAEDRKVPYTALIRQWISEGVARENGTKH